MTVVSRPVKPDDHIVLVDGSSYIFRAYHALPPLTRKSDGLPVGAVSGFCNMLWRLLRDTIDGEKPTHLAVVFDASAHTFRNELYDGYKAQRPEPPEDLRPQFPLIREAVRAFDLPCLEQQGYEADDLIATYAREAEEAGATVTIVGSDKDLMQLVTDKVLMFDPMKDKKIGWAEVIEKFGVPPTQVIDVQALAGDSVDNIPGAPGIGVKTAAQLLQDFGSLEALLERASEIKQPKRRETLLTFADQIRLSKQLVTLKNDVPLDTPLADIAVHDPDPRRLIAYLKAMEFNTLTRRVAETYAIDLADVTADAALAKAHSALPPAPETEGTALSRGSPSLSRTDIPFFDESAGAPVSADPFADLPDAPIPASRRLKGPRPQALLAQRASAAVGTPVDRAHYETVTSLPRLEAWIAAAREAGVLALDTETDSLDSASANLVGICLAVLPNRACYIPLQHKGGEDLFGGGLLPGQIRLEDAIKLLKPLLEDPAILKVGQNFKFDWLVLARHGIKVAPIDDTMLMSYVLDAGRGSHGMDDLSDRHLGHRPIPFSEIAGTGKNAITFDRVPLDKATDYAAEDADVTLRLWNVLKPRLVSEGRLTVYETLERPLVDVIARMEGHGISIDRTLLSRLSGEFSQTLARLEEEIYELAGSRFLIGSPKQLGDILFGRLGLPGAKKTATGQWATGVRILEDLAEQGHALPARILEWRQLSKLKSTYTDTLPTYINKETGRIHTSFSLAATTTGRLSSSDPNLQNIPIRTVEGRKIRSAFIAMEGHKLISADYSQIELRLLAHIADIPQLQRAFAEGIDIHSATASEIFGVPVDGMDPMIRRRAKAINFGIVYGISAFGLALQLNISREEAGAYIKTYFERFPGIRDYMEETKRQCRDQGYVRTLFGRICHYPQIKSSNPAERAGVERQAINAPIQGTAADIIRRAMIRMEDALSHEKLTTKMLLQVHDELVFEAPDEEIEHAIPVIKRVMEQAPHPAIALKVPLAVEARAAQNWEEAH